MSRPPGICCWRKFLPQSFVHIKHLLLSFPTTPGKIGLLVGVLRQTQLFNAQASALNSIQ